MAIVDAVAAAARIGIVSRDPASPERLLRHRRDDGADHADRESASDGRVLGEPSPVPLGGRRSGVGLSSSTPGL